MDKIKDIQGNIVGIIDLNRYKTKEERDRFRVRYLQRFGYKIPEDLKERVSRHDK